MRNRIEEIQVLLAVGTLLARGLVAREYDPERAAIRVNGRGYRYLSPFWTRTGVLEPEGAAWRIRLADETEASRAQVRVAEEWITAGAPRDWARAEAHAAVLLLRMRPDTAARA